MARPATLVAGLALLVGCSGPQSRGAAAVDDAGPRLVERAEEILGVVTSAHDGEKSPADVTSDVGTLVRELYASTEEEPLVLSFYLHDAGRDGGWDNGTLNVGGCMTIEVREGEGPDVENVPCPTSVQDEERTYLDVEVEVTTGEVADEG